MRARGLPGARRHHLVEAASWARPARSGGVGALRALLPVFSGRGRPRGTAASRGQEAVSRRPPYVVTCPRSALTRVCEARD